MRTTTIESPRERVAVARETGVGPVSPVAVLAGVLVGYAAFPVLLGATGALLRATGVHVDPGANWEEIGTTAGMVAGGLLFLAYLLGGYVSGRMAWRAGVGHGLLVCFGSLAVVAVVAALARAVADGEDVNRLTDAIKGFGVPTSAREWGQAGTVAGITSLLGMLVGSVLGGVWGERWYTKLSRRAHEVDLRAAERATPREDDRPLEELSRDELYHRAWEEGVPWRSSMTKEELAEALRSRR